MFTNSAILGKDKTLKYHKVIKTKYFSFYKICGALLTSVKLYPKLYPKFYDHVDIDPDPIIWILKAYLKPFAHGGTNSDSESVDNEFS